MLAPFDKSDWGAIAAAFESALKLPLGQAWSPEPEKKFRPGFVGVGWRDGIFWVRAVLDDDCLTTSATADNQNLWTLGDVFELFLRPMEGEVYYELHVAPSGHRLQLRFPDADMINRLREGKDRREDLLVDEPIFTFTTRTVPGGWEILAGVPAATFGWPAGDLSGRELLASFSRYDYSGDGSAPVLSSTSAHTIMNYHRQEDWKRLTLRA